jgi:hypothetical protein
MGCVAKSLIMVVCLIVGFFMFGMILSFNDSPGSPQTRNDPNKIIREEQDRQAKLCKDGYASACETEKQISDLLSAGGAPPR